MKFRCLKCGNDLGNDNINIQAMLGKCSACNEIIKLEVGLDVIEKPRNSGLKEDKYGNGGIAVSFPRRYGFGAFFVCFGLFWDLISGIIICIMIFKDNKIDLLSILIISLFFVAGLIILLFGISQLIINVYLIAEGGTLKLIRNFKVYEISNEINCDRTVSVSRVVRYHESHVPVHGAKIVGLNGKTIIVGSGLSDDEIFWLRNLIISTV